MAGLTPLSELAAGLDTDKESRHGYLSGMYDYILQPYRWAGMCSRLLEIGVWKGDSLRLWRSALPNWNIVGVDTAPMCDPGNMGRIQVVVADAYDPAFVATLGFFSVIIDDGPHTEESQTAFIRLYKSRLSPQGSMVIEDIPSMNRLERLIAEANRCGFQQATSFGFTDTHAPDSLALVLR